MIKYAVIDDYGDNWEEGVIAFSSTSLQVAEDWKENENYHSASIVQVWMDDETMEELKRELINGDD